MVLKYNVCVGSCVWLPTQREVTAPLHDYGVVTTVSRRPMHREGKHPSFASVHPAFSYTMTSELLNLTIATTFLTNEQNGHSSSTRSLCLQQLFSGVLKPSQANRNNQMHLQQRVPMKSTKSITKKRLKTQQQPAKQELME
jgi:hypothetical protein